MNIDPISHAKDHFLDDLSVFITKLIKSLDDRIKLYGDSEVIEEKVVLVSVSGV